jgi:hypothetical protein
MLSRLVNGLYTLLSQIQNLLGLGQCVCAICPYSSPIYQYHTRPPWAASVIHYHTKYLHASKAVIEGIMLNYTAPSLGSCPFHPIQPTPIINLIAKTNHRTGWTCPVALSIQPPMILPTSVSKKPAILLFLLRFPVNTGLVMSFGSDTRSHMRLVITTVGTVLLRVSY